MQFMHRPLTSDEWLHVRAAGNDAYRDCMALQSDEEIAGARADEAREEALQGILGESRPFTVFDAK